MTAMQPQLEQDGVMAGSHWILPQMMAVLIQCRHLGAMFPLKSDMIRQLRTSVTLGLNCPPTSVSCLRSLPCLQ